MASLSDCGRGHGRPTRGHLQRKSATCKEKRRPPAPLPADTLQGDKEHVRSAPEAARKIAAKIAAKIVATCARPARFGVWWRRHQSVTCDDRQPDPEIG